jgi:predicted PurR-regulated permease PerM
MTDLGRKVLIGLALLAIVLVLYVASPFAEALLMAAVLASAVSPTFERLAAFLGQRRMFAGAVFVVGIVFALVLPVVGIILNVVQQADDAVRPISAAFKEKGMDGVIADLPQPLPMIAKEVSSRLPAGDRQFQELLQGLTGRILGGVGSLFLATGGILFQTTMMLVGLFFMLVEGPPFVRWIVGVSPLTDDQTKGLLADFRDVSVAVLVGSVGTALVQTLVALLGYWLAGAKHALLLAAATFIGAFIPVVGAGSVVVASAVVLFFTGHSTAAIFLAIWGIGVVSSIDNFVKPYLMRGRLEVNTGVIFFALLGGAATFGPIGLLAGPLVVAFFLAVVRMCKKELGVMSLEPVALALGVYAPPVDPGIEITPTTESAVITPVDPPNATK